MESILKWLNGYSSPKKQKKKSNFVEKLKEEAKGVGESISEFFDSDESESTNKAFRSLLGIPQFKHLLPYVDYLDSEGLFLIDSGTLDDDGSGAISPGFVFQITPQTGATKNMERVLQSIFLQAPKGTSITVTLYGSPHIKSRMIERASEVVSDLNFGIEKEPWEERNLNVYRKAIRSRIDFYQSGAFKSLVKETRGYLLRDYHCLITVVMPDAFNKPGALEEALSYKDNLQSTLSSAHLPGRDWGRNDLLNWVSDLLEHERVLDKDARPVYKEFDPNLPVLKDNFGTTCGVNSLKKKSINHSSSNSSFVSMSVTDFPRNEWHLANMGDMIGDFFQGAISYPCPFFITMIAVVGDRNTFKTKADMMSARKTQLAESPSGRYIPGIYDEAAEWKQAVSALSDGATMCYLGLKVGIISPTKLVSKNTSEVKAVWRNRGFTIHEDTYLQPLGFKSMIPMGIGKMVTKDLHSMGHLSPKYSTNAVSLSPLIAEWKGTGTNTITLFGRRGQIMGIDLYDNDKGNYNFAVIAGSGSGKSFFLNELAFAYLSKGAKVWIIDVGRSYVKLCSVLKGDFVEFSEKSSPCLNPFTFVVDIKEEMEILKPLLSQMMTGDDYRLTSVQFSELEVAIQRTWEKYGNDASITKVREEMLEMANPNNPSCPVAAMAKMLYSWTKDGTYGEYFEGRANLDFNNSFTVLELEELNAKKSLQTVVLMILMYRITNEMYVKRDGQKKIVIIDEAWALMNGGDTAEFIEKGYRRARKYGGAFGTATQSVDDYYRNEASEAAINNADFVFMLRQKKESIERIGKEGKIHMDAWKKRTLLDLTTKGGVYSEIYVSSPIGEGVGRLFVDPYTSLLYSSKDEDYQAIMNYESQGYETAEAIELVLKDRGVMQ